MGYRQLLKKYMAHVDALIGNDLVEIAAITNALNKRELGELRALVAELHRDSFSQASTNQYQKIICSMVASGTIKLEQLGRIRGIEAGNESELIPEDQFRRIVASLAEASDH